MYSAAICAHHSEIARADVVFFSAYSLDFKYYTRITAQNIVSTAHSHTHDGPDEGMLFIIFPANTTEKHHN